MADSHFMWIVRNLSFWSRLSVILSVWIFIRLAQIRIRRSRVRRPKLDRAVGRCLSRDGSRIY